MLSNVNLLAFISIATLAVNAASSSGSSTATSPLPSNTAMAFSTTSYIPSDSEAPAVFRNHRTNNYLNGE
jgi:hypothetical protein